MGEDLALLIEAESYLEADFIVSLLDSYGIPCLVKREHPYAVDARYTVGPLAQHRIYVNPEDFVRAQEILAAEPDPRDIPGE